MLLSEKINNLQDTVIDMKASDKTITIPGATEFKNPVEKYFILTLFSLCIFIDSVFGIPFWVYLNTIGKIV